MLISKFRCKVTKILAYIKIFLYLCMIFLKEGMKKYIYQDSTIAFVTAAAQTCLLIEQLNEHDREEWREQLLRLLPVLYLRARLLEEAELMMEDEPQRFVTEEDYNYALVGIRERLGQDHSRDFLTVGSMGHAIMIALGIAKAQPTRKVICLDGDGASIMHLGNMAICGQSGCSNLTHIVLNNAAHDSVGGQPTVGGKIDFEKIAEDLGYDVLQSPQDQYVGARQLGIEEVADGMKWLVSMNALEAQAAQDACVPSALHPNFILFRIAKGARKDLGRPKEPPQVNKELFMQTLEVQA